MNTPLLLTHSETCPRKGYWSRTRERMKLEDTEMLQAAIRAGLTETVRTDYGELAGETCYGLGNQPGLETAHHDLYGEVVHLSCIADAVTSALRKNHDPAWRVPERVRWPQGPQWISGVYMSPDGSHLRRVVLATSWSDDRHYSEARSWFSLGECAAYDLPMQQAVIVLGQRRSGKRHSAWARGLRHPANKKLRFRKKNDVGAGFKNTWLQVWREDFDDISTAEWLTAMLEDGVLPELCFNVDIPAPAKPVRDRIREMAERKIETLLAMETVPDPQLTGCDWPRPCIFRTPCHGGREPQQGVFKILENGF